LKNAATLRTDLEHLLKQEYVHKIEPNEIAISNMGKILDAMEKNSIDGSGFMLLANGGIMIYWRGVLSLDHYARIECQNNGEVFGERGNELAEKGDDPEYGFWRIEELYADCPYCADPQGVAGKICTCPSPGEISLTLIECLEHIRSFLWSYYQS
jgi:hypothetical protein